MLPFLKIRLYNNESKDHDAIVPVQDKIVPRHYLMNNRAANGNRSKREQNTYKRVWHVIVTWQDSFFSTERQS